MGLVVEEMGDGDVHPDPARRGTHDAGVGELRIEVRLAQAAHPIHDVAIGLHALAPQRVEVAVQLLRERAHGKRHAGEPAHPHAIGQQQVVERPVDRLEEGAGVLLALLVGELRAARVELLVHPPVVAGHAAGVNEQVHDGLSA